MILLYDIKFFLINFKDIGMLYIKLEGLILKKKKINNYDYNI